MRLVLELGTSYNWARPAVGIVRVERKFAEYILERDDIESAFCRHDPNSGTHIEIPRETVAQIIRRETAPVTVSPPPNLRDRLKQATNPFSGAVPKAIRPEAREFALAGWNLACGVANLATDPIRKLADRGRATEPTSEPFPFRPDDVYLSMGADWSSNDFTLIRQEADRSGHAVVLFCYDTIPVRFPHLTDHDGDWIPYYRSYFARMAHTADRVAAISETSRRDYLEVLREESIEQPPPVDVVVLGSDPIGNGINPRPWPELEGKPFILCVGSVYPHKNHETLYNAWDRLAERNGEAIPHLVIVGTVPPTRAELLRRFFTNPRLKGRIHLIDRAGDDTLSWLYHHCLFTVFPSLYEGWGLPVVESLAAGKPCLCSTAPAVLEASAGLAEAIDPYNGPAWADAVERLWLNPEARSQAASKIAREYKPPTWTRFSDQLVSIARMAAEKRLERSASSESSG